MGKLIFRGKPYEDELVKDYVERIGFFNGFENTPRFCRWLDKVFRKDFCEDYSEFRPDRRRRFVLGYQIAEKINEIELPSESIQGRISADRRAICLLCFQISAYIRAYWHLNGYKTCHVHYQPLSYFQGNPYENIKLLGAIQKYRLDSKVVENCVSKLDSLNRIRDMSKCFEWSALEIDVVYGMFECLRMDGLTRVEGKKHVICEIQQAILVGESFSRRSAMICTSVGRYILADSGVLERLFCMLVWCAPQGNECAIRGKYVSVYSSWAVKRLFALGLHLDQWIHGISDTKAILIRFLDNSVISDRGFHYLAGRINLVLGDQKLIRDKQRWVDLGAGFVDL